MADHLKEERQTFRFDNARLTPWPETGDKNQYRTRVFKSGNSLAVRIPVGTKLEAGMEMDLVVEDGVMLSLKPIDAPKRKIDISKFAGKAPWLKELPRYDFEDSPRDWHLLEQDKKRPV